MKRLLLAALLIAAPVVAQQKDAPTTKVVTLKYADPEQMKALVRMYGVDIGANPFPNPGLRAVSLRGTPEQIAAAEAAIKQYDVPPKTIELVVHFVVGTNQPTPNAPPVPPEVREVINQLKGTFTFKDYSMLDTLTLRTRAGSHAHTSGIVSGGSPPRLSQFSIDRAYVSDDGTIRIDHMQAGLRIPTGRTPASQTSKGGSEPANQVQYLNTGIEQDVDVKEGQKVVVGRASLDGPEKALFLILTARVVQ